EYTPPVTYPEEVEKTLGTPIEVEPLNETKLKEVGLNCNHNTPFSSREVLSFDGLEPQPLLNSPSLDASLGDVIGPEPPIKPHSPDSSRMKVVDYLTTQTPPSPHMENSYPKGVYSYYNPGEKLSLFDKPNKVERGRILEAHRLQSILQQQISQRMDPSHHDGRKAYLLEDKQIPSVGVFDEALLKAIKHELDVTVHLHVVRCEFERQKEERLKMAKEVAELKDEANLSKQSTISHCSQTMSSGARNSRIYALENMFATPSSTIILMASRLSEAEEREHAFSGKGRWNHVRSLADAKTVMNNVALTFTLAALMT
nr:kinesin-like protein KIN-4C [Tanacetum cinerariifolium]